MERKVTKKKILSGTVVSTKSSKTIIVNVNTFISHPTYKKRVLKSKKFAAHDEKGIAGLGDVVSIQECRPLSKTKHFRLLEIKKKAEVKGE